MDLALAVRARSVSRTTTTARGNSLPYPISPDKLDLPLAWNRASRDLDSRRAFVRHPYLEQMVSSDLDGWLGELSSRLAAGTFRAGTCRVVPVPKPLGQVRPGADLHLADQVVYSALLQRMWDPIAAAVGYAAESPDYSYHLRSEAGHAEWFEPFFARWQAFDRDSVTAIDQGAQFVVIADVAGYYEHIDLSTLRSDLNGLGVDAVALNILMECLHRWARVQRRGVPQGHGPSDILAKVYLHPVDLTLRAEGFAHRRWVDDLRIFCRTEAEGRRALVVLADALGRRGLVLQSGKSRVFPAAAARERFDMVRTLLDPIQTAVAIQLQGQGGEEPSYLPPWEVDAALAAAGSEGAVEVLRSALTAYFLEPGREFNKTLFHYLLRRLSASRDTAQAAAVVGLLRNIPEEFDYLADYCGKVGGADALERELLSLWDQGLLPYPYLAYQFFRWRVREERPISDRLRTFARSFAFEAGHPWFVRSASRALLGKLGDAADLERLEAAYADAQSSIERAEILCSLQRMELGRRNALFGRAAGDGELPSRAVRLARAGEIRFTAC